LIALRDRRMRLKSSSIFNAQEIAAKRKAERQADFENEDDDDELEK